MLLGNLILRFQILVDWLSLVFFLANFGSLGCFVIFFTAPSIVKQFYLVCVSVIMAWSLSKLPEWSNWTILVALALYDLFAVLSPCGPLKALVEMSQSRNEPIPGLVYEADAPESSESPPAVPSQPPDSTSNLEQDEGPVNVNMRSDTGPRQRGCTSGGSGSSGAGADGASIEMQSVEQVVSGDSRVAPDDAAAAASAAVAGQARAEEEDEMGGGVKLGLGDFVFYSVLVSRCVAGRSTPCALSLTFNTQCRAASTNMTVVVTTFGAIVFGLCSTLVLLNIVR